MSLKSLSVKMTNFVAGGHALLMLLTHHMTALSQ